jgi:hypothetical protein
MAAAWHQTRPRGTRPTWTQGRPGHAGGSPLAVQRGSPAGTRPLRPPQVPGTCTGRNKPVPRSSHVARRPIWELPSLHGPSPPPPCRRRLVPRHHPRQQQRPVLPGRRRPPRLPAPAPPSDPPLRLAPPRPLPARQPLPPPRRDAAPQPLRRHARSQRRVRACLQRAPRTLRPRLRAALLLATRRNGGASRDRAGVHPAEPGRRRARPKCRRLAVDVDSQPSPFDRFADACLTTPTS